MESIFRSICEKKAINTGFLKGPFCPIYGVGAVIMIVFLKEFQSNLLLLFVVSTIVLTVWEYVVGFFLEKIFHTKYWDYSDKKINLNGRICLTNSLAWGILGVVFVKFIHPFMENLITKVNINVIIYVEVILCIVLIVDMITTIIHVKNIKFTLQKIEKLNKEIKDKIKEISESTLLKKEKEEKLSAVENIQCVIEDLKKKRNRMILHLYKNVYRLKKAFPAINTAEIAEILNKKNELKNIKEKLKKGKKKKLKKD